MRMRHTHILLTVLLHLFLWCGGICPLYAQTLEHPADTLQHEARRARKTAQGRVKEQKILPPAPPTSAPTDSVAPAAPTDSLVADSLAPLPVPPLAVDSTIVKQVTDSLANLTWSQRASRFKPEPTRALWLALAIPGAGQVYNRKYWKIPIVYGGFLGCVYALTWNAQMLSDYQQAYLDISDNDPTTCSYMKMLPMGYDITGREARFKEIFKQRKDYYRKYRDLSIFAFGAVYLLSVIDAYVDAELSTFDISTDLTLHWGPTFMETAHITPRRAQHIPAISVTLEF